MTHDPFFPVDLFVNIFVLFKPPTNQLTNCQSTSKQPNNKLKFLNPDPHILGSLLQTFFFNYWNVSNDLCIACFSVALHIIHMAGDSEWPPV